MDVEAQCGEIGVLLRNSIRAILAVSQIVASIVILALSKHENPHYVPLRGYVIGHICACALTLALLAFDFCSSTSDENENSRLSTFFTVLLVLFYIAWTITGIVWVYRERSTRSDSPQLYWLSVVLIILGIFTTPGGASCSCGFSSSSD